jgi:hypothetical protein
MSKRKTKELDHHLKNIIGKVPDMLKNFIKSDDQQLLYYSGEWAKDVYDNFTDKQAEKIFKKIEKIQPDLMFFQKKLPEFSDEEGNVYGGYDYIVRKKHISVNKMKVRRTIGKPNTRLTPILP